MPLQLMKIKLLVQLLQKLMVAWAALGLMTVHGIQTQTSFQVKKGVLRWIATVCVCVELWLKDASLQHACKQVCYLFILQPGIHSKTQPATTHTFRQCCPTLSKCMYVGWYESQFILYFCIGVVGSPFSYSWLTINSVCSKIW